MDVLQLNIYVFAIWIVAMQSIGLTAEQIPVHHTEGVSLGFLALNASESEI